MRPGDEGGVADQRHAPERNARQFKIEDRLQDDLRGGVHQRGKLRREQRGGVALDRGDQFRTDQRRRDRGAVRAAGRVGANRRPARSSAGRNQTKWQARSPSPAAPASGSTASARRPESRTPCDATSDRADRAASRRLDHAPPGHVAGIARREAWQQMRPHRRMQAIGRDQQIGLGREPSANIGGNAGGLLVRAGAAPAAGIAVVRHRLPQRPPDARPGAGDGADRQFVDDARRRDRARCGPGHSIPSEASAASPMRRITANSSSRVPMPVPRSPRSPAARSNTRDVPAGLAQQMRGKQTADRAADHQCACLGQASAPSCRDAAMMTIRVGRASRVGSEARSESRAKSCAISIVAVRRWALNFSAAWHYIAAIAVATAVAARMQMSSAFYPRGPRAIRRFSCVLYNRSLQFPGFRQSLRAPQRQMGR